MSFPEHETIINISAYDGMEPEERKKYRKDEELTFEDTCPPFFTFGTSNKKVWERFLRKIGGVKKLISWWVGSGNFWYQALVPIEFYSPSNFGIRKNKRARKPLSMEHKAKLLAGRKNGLAK